jgi:hypothetical protein
VGEKKNKDTKLEQIIYDGYFVKLLGTIGLFRFSTDSTGGSKFIMPNW